MKKILIIEDDFAIRQSIEYALRRCGYKIKSLDNGQRALDVIVEFAPDLIILDIMLPEKSGHEICEELRRVDNSTLIIMVSALNEEHDRIFGLNLGADDYVPKPFSLEELLARVHANLRRLPEKGRSEAEAGEPLQFGALHIDPKTFDARYGEHSLHLRAKEFTLLYTLAKHPNEVLTRMRLSQEVWGQQYLASSRTIDVHVRRLRAVLEDAGAQNYIRTAHGVGYRFNPQGGDSETPRVGT